MTRRPVDVRELFARLDLIESEARECRAVIRENADRILDAPVSSVAVYCLAVVL